MAAYSFAYAGSKITAQLNVTNLFDRTYYPSETNYAPLVPAAGQPLLFMSSFRSYGAPFAVMGSLRAELDEGGYASAHGCCRSRQSRRRCPPSPGPASMSAARSATASATTTVG